MTTQEVLDRVLSTLEEDTALADELQNVELTDGGDKSRDIRAVRAITYI